MAKIAEGVVKREELFVVSKLWNTFHRPDLVRDACETTLKKLQLDYLDLYLIHWPMALKEGGEFFPTENGQPLYSDSDYLDTWKEMEKLVDAGLVKSIGISNFNAKQVDRLMKTVRIKPVTNQVESHPYLVQSKLEDHLKQYGIVLTAYSPLGSPARTTDLLREPLMKEPVVVAIAEKNKKSAAQVLIRYQLQKDRGVLVKSINKANIISNTEVYDFVLTSDDMAALDGLDRGLHLIYFTP